MPKGDVSRRKLELNKIERIGIEKYNNQNCLMKIIEYNDANNIVIEFQDEYRVRINTSYKNFLTGRIKNPYSPSVDNIGIIGNKYPIKIDKEFIKEYVVWRHMIHRCFNKKFKDANVSYKDVICCNEWVYYDNFYEWLHAQENFNKWANNKKWHIDKDIIIKGNKVYSPENCCLVPQSINNLFIRQNFNRGEYPIGVAYNADKNTFDVHCSLNHKCIYLGSYNTIEEAFQVYKQYKENLIKQAAKEEYGKGNITKRCYDAMMNYKVENTD